MPFGIDDALIWAPLAGAAIGGLTSKNPLQGAAMGGALGYAGASVPGLLATSGGAAPAAAGIADGTAAGFAPMSAADYMKSQIAASPATTTPSAGLLSDSSLKSVMDNYVKPVGTAMNAGLAAKGLLSSQPSQVQASPVMAGGGAGSQALAQLANQAQQETQNELDQAAQLRAARRKSMIGGM